MADNTSIVHAARSLPNPGARRRSARVPPGAVGIATRTRTLLLNLLSLAITLVVWELVSEHVASPYFPGPMAIVRAFVQLALHGDILGNTLLQNIDASLMRLLVGFGLGTVLGVPLGLLMGLKKQWYASTRVVIEPFRFIPPIAWIPLAIIFFTGMTRYAFLIFLGAFFPIFTATMVGVGRAETIHRKVLQVYGASKFYILLHAVVPSVLPDILAGMRVGLGTAWMTIVAAELTGGSSLGLGRMMVNYSEILRIPEVVVAMMLIGLLGFLFNEVILLAERRLFRWRWQVSL
ncbi:MAG: ABC transporter permease [Betaproteobacteria bacterium]|nr:ABC transporter permease [Betaproteobacteria bacterium]